MAEEKESIQRHLPRNRPIGWFAYGTTSADTVRPLSVIPDPHPSASVSVKAESGLSHREQTKKAKTRIPLVGA
ncbi:unnamed protein product [Sympodiomycopsis kandeliae]